MPGIQSPRSKRTENGFKHEDDEDVYADDETERLVLVGEVAHQALFSVFHRGVPGRLVVLFHGVNEVGHRGDDDTPGGAEHGTESVVKLGPHLEGHVGAETCSEEADRFSHGG